MESDFLEEDRSIKRDQLPLSIDSMIDELVEEVNAERAIEVPVIKPFYDSPDGDHFITSFGGSTRSIEM